MKKFIINEEEKKRILMMHKSATRKQYLSESNGSVFDDLVGKNAIFKPDGIFRVTKYGTKEEVFGSNILDIEGLMDENSSVHLEKITNATIYGKIKEIGTEASGSEFGEFTDDKFAINVKLTSDMPELNQNSGEDFNMGYRCKEGIFYFVIDFTDDNQWDFEYLGWLANTKIEVKYTCKKLSDILDTRMPCSEESFDFSLNQETEPSTLA